RSANAQHSVIAMRLKDQHTTARGGKLRFGNFAEGELVKPAERPICISKPCSKVADGRFVLKSAPNSRLVGRQAEMRPPRDQKKEVITHAAEMGPGENRCRRWKFSGRGGVSAHFRLLGNLPIDFDHRNS